MITFKDTHALTDANGFTAEMVVEFIGDYFVRGKAIDPAKEDPHKLFNRVRWIMDRVGRVLDVSGKLNPETATFKIDRDSDGQTSVRFLDENNNQLYRLNVIDGERYVLLDNDGHELVSDPRWTAIRAFFASSSSSSSSKKTETVLKEAAAPKKREKNSKVSKNKIVKSPVPAVPTETDIITEVDTAIAEVEAVEA